MLSNLDVNCCKLLILTAFVPYCTAFVTSTLEILLNSSIETALKIAFIALLLNVAAFF